MRALRSILLLTIIAVMAVNAQSPEITSFFDSANRYDYLIITPQFLSGGASTLAEYRTAFSEDDVSSAGFVVLEKLLAQVSQPQRAPDSILRESISWAVENWAQPPSYIVLLGDDSVSNADGEITYGNRGPMPTHIFGCRISTSLQSDLSSRSDTSFEYSDDWYVQACLDSVYAWNVSSGQCYNYCSNPPVALGRIPCEQPEQLERYLQKVQRYDSQRGGAPWRNRVLLVADDRFENGIRDRLDHASYVYSTVKLLPGRFLSELFFSDYTVNGQAGYVEAKNAFFSQVNSGAGLTLLYAHGGPSQITGEHIVEARDYSLFNNAEMPTIFFSLGCLNGAFYVPQSASICKRFLFDADGGAIAYVANPNTTIYPYSYPFMERMLQLHDSLPGMSVGKLVAEAKKNGCFSSARSFEVLGDPALRYGLPDDRLDMQLSGDGRFTCTAAAGGIDSGSLYWEITEHRVWYDSTAGTTEKRDVVLYSGTTPLSKGSCRLIVPSLPESEKLVLTAYAWNESFASSGTLDLYNVAGPSLPPPMPCSFTSEITAGSYEKMTVAFGDSLAIGVVGDNKVFQWVRQTSGFRGGVPLALSSGCEFIDALAPLPGGYLVIAQVVYQGGGDHAIRRVTLNKIDRGGKQSWSFCDTAMRIIHGIKGMYDGGCVAWGESYDRTSGTLLFRLDVKGMPLWRTTLPDDSITIEEISGKGYIFTGSIGATGGSGPIGKALHLGAIGLTGELLWEKTFSKDSGVCGVALAPIANGRWIVAGTTATGGTTTGMWVLCVTGTGDTLWSRTITNSSVSSCLMTGDGTIAVGGSLGTDGIVLLFDREGKQLYTMKVPGGRIRLLATCRSAYRFLIAFVAGNKSRESIGFLSGIGTDIDRQSVNKAKPDFPRFGTSVSSSRNILFTLSPPQKSGTFIDLFDLHGRHLQRMSFPPGAGRLLLNGSRISPGTYIAQIKAGEKLLRCRMVVGR